MRYLLVFLFVLSGWGVKTAWGACDGKTIFKSHKCTKCHTLKKVGIATVTKSADDEDEEEGEDEKAPDLSKFSKKVAGQTDSPTVEEHLKKWMKKQAVHGTKKHKARFKGSDSELDCLVKYLINTAGGK